MIVSSSSENLHCFCSLCMHWNFKMLVFLSRPGPHFSYSILRLRKVVNLNEGIVYSTAIIVSTAHPWLTL